MLSEQVLTPRQQVLAATTAEGFWWMTGFEASNIPQIKADEYHWTQHYNNWWQDFGLIHQRLGLRRLRYTLPWYKLNPERHRFEWDWADRVMARAEELDLELIVNPIHFGTPLWMENSFGNPDFPQYAAEYFSQIARRYGRQVKFYTPHNEPLISALFCGDFGHWPPYWKGLHNYVRLVENIGRQIILSTEAVRAEVPEAQMVHVEAGEYYATRRPEKWLQQDVRLRNERRFLCYDLISGGVGPEHPLTEWLLQHGMKDTSLNWFRERAIELDVVGVDFYPHGEAWLDLAGRRVVQDRDHGYKIVQAFAVSHDSTQVRDEVGLPISLSGLLRQYYERYQRPVMLTETDYCGLNEHKSLYMEYGVQEIRRLRAEGVPVLGYTWWPALDHLNWDKALKERGHIHPVGLWSLEPQADGTLKRVETETANLFRELIANPVQSVGDVVIKNSL